MANRRAGQSSGTQHAYQQVANNSNPEGLTGAGLFLGPSGDNITELRVLTPDLDPASVSADSVSTQTFTVSGLTTDDVVIVNAPDLTDGLVVSNARVSSADTLELTFYNHTSSAIDESSATWDVIALRTA